MKSLPSRRKPEPIDRTTATLTICFVNSPRASDAELQKEVPSIIMIMYALRERYLTERSMQPRQHVTHKHANLATPESPAQALSRFMIAATMIRTSCNNVIRREPKATEPACLVSTRKREPRHGRVPGPSSPKYQVAKVPEIAQCCTCRTKQHIHNPPNTSRQIQPHVGRGMCRWPKPGYARTSSPVENRSIRMYPQPPRMRRESSSVNTG